MISSLPFKDTQLEWEGRKGGRYAGEDFLPPIIPARQRQPVQRVRNGVPR